MDHTPAFNPFFNLLQEDNTNFPELCLKIYIYIQQELIRIEQQKGSKTPHGADTLIPALVQFSSYYLKDLSQKEIDKILEKLNEQTSQNDLIAYFQTSLSGVIKLIQKKDENSQQDENPLSPKIPYPQSMEDLDQSYLKFLKAKVKNKQNFLDDFMLKNQESEKQLSKFSIALIEKTQTHLVSLMNILEDAPPSTTADLINNYQKALAKIPRPISDVIDCIDSNMNTKDLLNWIQSQEEIQTQKRTYLKTILNSTHAKTSTDPEIKKIYEEAEAYIQTIVQYSSEQGQSYEEFLEVFEKAKEEKSNCSQTHKNGLLEALWEFILKIYALGNKSEHSKKHRKPISLLSVSDRPPENTASSRNKSQK